MSQWRGVSEVVGGLLLLDLINPDAIDPGKLHPPYDILAKLKRKNPNASKAELFDHLSPSALYIAEDAARSVEGNPYSFVESAGRCASRVHAGKKLAPLVAQLERGEDVDIGRISSAITNLEDNSWEFTPASEITPAETLYRPSFYAPQDKYVGGHPEGGLEIIAGIAGTGKTTYLIRLAEDCARNRKYCAILTLEMWKELFVRRLIQTRVPKKYLKYILLSDDVYTFKEAYAAGSRLMAQRPDIHFIGIDYADMLVGMGEQSESIMGAIYNGCAVMAKKLRVPIVLLAQYRRTQGKMPTIEDIRYSARAEQAASVILLLYNMEQVWHRSSMQSEDNPLDYIPGQAYIIVGKVRMQEDDRAVKGVGAIRVPWNEKGGKWEAEPAVWKSLVGAM